MTGSIFSFAQDCKYEIGVDGGPGVRLVYGLLNTQVKQYSLAYIGGSAGVSFQYNIDKIFSVKTAISYDIKGAEESVVLVDQYGIMDPALMFHINLNYLTLPVLVKASFGKKIKFFINAGPYLSVLLKEENKFPYAYPWTDMTNSYKPIDFGIQAGLGISIPIKKRFDITLEDRTSIGLIDIRKNSIPADGHFKTFSSALFFGFNYKFGKTKTTTKSS